MVNNRRGQGLDQGCLDAFFSIAAPMERASRRIEADCGLIILDVQINPDIRLSGINGRPYASGGSKRVNHRVFQAEGGKFRVSQPTVGHGGKNGKGLRRIEKVLPFYLPRLFVQIAVGVTPERRERSKHAGNQAGVKINSIEHFL